MCVDEEVIEPTLNEVKQKSNNFFYLPLSPFKLVKEKEIRSRHEGMVFALALSEVSEI